MTVNPLERCKQATTITTVAVLAAVAALMAAAIPARAAIGRPTPLLAQGAGMGAKPSVQVRVVQRALLRRRYDLGPPGVDGRFGPRTDAAVRRMQADHAMTVDRGRGPRDARDAATHASSRHADAATAAQCRSAAKSRDAGACASDGGGAGSREALVAPVHRRAPRSDSFLAWTLGALIAQLLVIAVVVTRRRRDHLYATSSPPARPIAQRTAYRSNGKEVRTYAPLSANGTEQGSPPMGAAIRKPAPRLRGARE